MFTHMQEERCIEPRKMSKVPAFSTTLLEVQPVYLALMTRAHDGLLICVVADNLPTAVFNQCAWEKSNDRRMWVERQLCSVEF